MRFIRKMEQKFGRYAIRNLPAIIIGLYAAGYILSLMAPNILRYLTLEPYYILQGQVWRLVTWIIVPPDSLGIFTLIMLFFYFSIGQALERTWGSFLFNLYFFGGMLFSVLGAFLLYGWFVLYMKQPALFGGLFSTYYINMSIFLAFALSYPETSVYLYFIIPVKMKWMGVLYGVLIVLSFIRTTMPGRVAIAASLLNFILFWILTGSWKRLKFPSPSQAKRRQEFRREVKKVKPQMNGGTIHRCAVCGRTEKDGEHMEFRFCSKCQGSYEYCQDHLFTHTHVRLDKTE